MYGLLPFSTITNLNSKLNNVMPTNLRSIDKQHIVALLIVVIKNCNLISDPVVGIKLLFYIS